MVIPDTQVRPGVPLDHLDWIGRYIVDRKPDVIVHLGDHWDMPSLSSWDKGKMAMEGRRYKDDIAAGNKGLTLLDRPTQKFNWRRQPANQYNPRKVLLRGNHEHRIVRAVEDNPHLEGFLSYDDLDTRDWEVHDFLHPVFIDGIGYCHYWPNPLTGKPYGGMMETRLKNIGHSFTQGHVQTLQAGVRFVHSPEGPKRQWGLVCGAFYLHDEDYRVPMSQGEWRGLIVKHQVEDGSYDPMLVSMDYLCRRYTGMSVGAFLRENYPDMTGTLWGQP